MKTYIECIPCFFQQALDAASAAGASEKTKKKIVNELCRKVSKFPLDRTPPEMGRIIYNTVKRLTGNKDSFKEVKKRSNRLALGLYDELKRMIAHSPDRLLKAVELAIIGNSIDYGAQRSFDVEKEVKKLLNREFDFDKKGIKAVFDYKIFDKMLSEAGRILYLGDNAGEIVFDRLLIEEILHLNGKYLKEIVFVVRGGPIINDVLMGDAFQCGINGCAKVISSRCDAPGVVMDLCSKEFKNKYKQADLIISKGQGNFESLPHGDKRIFYMFRVKCPVVSKDMNCPIGSMILKRNGHC